MTFPVVDPIVAPTAAAVLEALLDAYDDPAWGLTPPCAAGLVAGSGLIADFCCASESADGTPCQGQLTVRVTNAFPTDTFPNLRGSAMPACGSSWAVEMEVAVLRCAPQIDTDAVPPILPSMAEEAEAADVVLADAGLIRHALTDYAVRAETALHFGAWSPMGPEGGCLGGALAVTVLVE